MPMLRDKRAASAFGQSSGHLPGAVHVATGAAYFNF